MRSILVAFLAVAVVLLHDPRAGEAATPPDPMDRAALDVVLSGTERLCDRQVAALRREATRLWHQAGIVLEWPEQPRPPRAYVRAQLDWTPSAGAGRSQTTRALGWILFVDGRPANRTIVLSASAAADLARQVVVDDRPITALPETLREGLLVRILARALAHEVGHYILGPAHANGGLMQARFSIAQLIDPSPSRFRLSRQQAARLRNQAAEGAPGSLSTEAETLTLATRVGAPW